MLLASCLASLNLGVLICEMGKWYPSIMKMKEDGIMCVLAELGHMLRADEYSPLFSPTADGANSNFPILQNVELLIRAFLEVFKKSLGVQVKL